LAAAVGLRGKASSQIKITQVKTATMVQKKVYVCVCFVCLMQNNKKHRNKKSVAEDRKKNRRLTAGQGHVTYTPH